MKFLDCNITFYQDTFVSKTQIYEVPANDRKRFGNPKMGENEETI